MKFNTGSPYFNSLMAMSALNRIHYAKAIAKSP